MRVVGFFLLLLSGLVNANETDKLENLLDTIWHYEMSVSPIQATSQGYSDYSHLLPDVSPEALKEQLQQRQTFVKQLQELEQSQLPREQQITLQIQLRELQNDIDQYQFNAHFMPLTSEYGFHSSLAFLPRSTPFNTSEDYQNYIKRLQQFPEYFQQQINWMKKGIVSGLTQPQVVMNGFEDSIKAFIKSSPTDSDFYQPFTQMNNVHLTEETRKQLIAQGTAAIDNAVFPAYQQFYDFFVNEYLPAAKDNIAAKSWPNGEAYYQNRAAYYTTTDMSADEIHQIGLQQVASIRSQMMDVLAELEYKGDLKDFIHFLRTDPRFYATSAEDLLKEASYIAKQVDAKLPKLFYKLPRTPYGVAPVPESIAPKYTTGRYISPTRDDQPGYYWVNTYALDKRPLYALPALTLHEAVPGHHLQNMLAREMGDMPPIRRFTYISAFGEGWGLYSELLGKEIGIYKDPYQEFGRLSYEMWRACRLVVDTGMHVKGWSRQQALDYMMDNTALSEHNVRTEIDRYISWPGQALSYKIGELTIRKLRKEAEQQLGAEFDLRAFHDAILAHGSVPLDILSENIRTFIEQNRNN